MGVALQYLRYSYRKHGLWMLMSIAMLTASTVGYFALVRTSEANYASLAKQLAVKQHELKIGPPSAESPDNTGTSFYQVLPQYSELEKMLAILFAAANDHELWFDQVTYKMEITPKSHFNRYHISMPVSGNYIKIRQFLNDVMTQIPSLALNQISFTTDGQSDSEAQKNEVQANIEFTLFTQVQP